MIISKLSMAGILKSCRIKLNGEARRYETNCTFKFPQKLNNIKSVLNELQES